MKKIIFLAAASLLLASCENNDDNTLSSYKLSRITASIGEDVSTRAKDDTWSPGDVIGISSTVGAGDGHYINVKYTTDGTGVFEGAPLYYYNSMTLTAYYPFTGSEKKAPGLIKVVTDAANQTPENQPQIDFLWDSKTNVDRKDFSVSNTTVNFTFTHRMSKLTFAFRGSEPVIQNGIEIAPEVKVSDIVAYEIEGLVMDGSFDTATGICAIDDNAETQKIKIDIPKGDVKEEIDLFPLIFFPQKPGNTNVKLHVYTDELENTGVLQHYICTLTFGDGELKPGNSYKYTVQVSRVGLILGKITIDDWNTERDVNLTATVDGGVNNDDQE